MWNLHRLMIVAKIPLFEANSLSCQTHAHAVHVFLDSNMIRKHRTSRKIHQKSLEMSIKIPKIPDFQRPKSAHLIPLGCLRLPLRAAPQLFRSGFGTELLCQLGE